MMIVFFASSAFASINKQFIVPINDSQNIMSIMESLYIKSNMALPSSTMPFSVAELDLMADQIKIESLNKNDLDHYKYLRSFINSYKIDSDSSINHKLSMSLDFEAYSHLNTKYFVDKSDWVYDFNDQKKFLTINFDFMVEDFSYSYVNFLLSAAERTYKEDPSSLSFGEKLFATNIPFLDVVDSENISTELNDRAFIVFGGNNWTAQFGRDNLSWGNGVSGNLLISDNLEYQNIGRYTFFDKDFKYTFVASFFPFQGNYVVEDSNDFNNLPSQELKGFSMFSAHKLEGRTLFGRLGWGLSEGNMFSSSDGSFDISTLNPLLSYHSLFYKANCNSILSADLDYTFNKNLNLYAQIVIDDLIAPIGESQTNSWSPNAYGVLFGLRFTSDAFRFNNISSIEFAYTTPYLYLRNNGQDDSEQSGYGINYIVALRKHDSAGIYYNKKFLGYEYGGDAIVLNINNQTIFDDK